MAQMTDNRLKLTEQMGLLRLMGY